MDHGNVFQGRAVAEGAPFPVLIFSHQCGDYSTLFPGVCGCEVSLRWLREKGELPHCFLSVGSVSQEEGFASRNPRQNYISPM